MQLELLGSIVQAVGVQRIALKNTTHASHLFCRITATELAAVATTEDDFGTFRLIRPDGNIVNCTGRMLRALNNEWGGAPVYTPGTGGAASAIEFYVVIPRRTPGDSNVDFWTEADNVVFEWEPGPNLNGRLTAGSFLLNLYAVPCQGRYMYDLRILRQTRPLNASQRDTIQVQEDNIALIALSDASNVPESLGAGNLRTGLAGASIGPMRGYAFVEDYIAITQALTQLEGVTDPTDMCVIFDAAVNGEGYGADLYDTANVEIQNGAGGVATAALLIVAKRMRKKQSVQSQLILNSRMETIKDVARAAGKTTKLDRLEELGA